MAKIGNSAVKIIDESNLPANVNDAGRLEVDVASLSIGDVTVALDSDNDSVECIQDTAAHLLATVTQHSTARTVNLITGFALETGGNLTTIAGDTTSIDGKITACNTGAVVVSSGAITETNSGTIAGDTTSIDGKITACNTGAVVVSTMPSEVLIAGGATQTNDVKVTLDSESVAVTGTVGHNITTIASDEMDVTTAGTALVLSVSQACKKVDIQAKITNTGKIYIGGSTVDSDEGLELRRGDIYSLEIGDLNNVYVDSSVDGEGVRYTWYG